MRAARLHRPAPIERRPLVVDDVAPPAAGDVRTERDDRPDGLVAWNDRYPPLGELALHHVQVGPTDRAHRHANEQLGVADRGRGDILDHQRAALDRGGAMESGRTHATRPTAGDQTGRSPVARRVLPSRVYAAIVRCAMRIWCTSSAPSAKRAQRACWYMCASGVSVE